MLSTLFRSWAPLQSLQAPVSSPYRTASVDRLQQQVGELTAKTEALAEENAKLRQALLERQTRESMRGSYAVIFVLPIVCGTILLIVLSFRQGLAVVPSPTQAMEQHTSLMDAGVRADALGTQLDSEHGWHGGELPMSVRLPLPSFIAPRCHRRVWRSPLLADLDVDQFRYWRILRALGSPVTSSACHWSYNCSPRLLKLLE